MNTRLPARRLRAAFTLIEVMICAVLILIGLGSILAMNSKSIQTLRATRQAAASSQILQQRIESIRSKPWPEVSNSTALATLMTSATNSEKEMADSHFTERMTVAALQQDSSTVAASTEPISLQRKHGRAQVLAAGDFGSEPTLLFENTVTWRDVHGVHQRTLRTLVCRAGLTRSGIFGSALGRYKPGTSSPAQ